jgi:sodium/proline symporter
VSPVRRDLSAVSPVRRDLSSLLQHSDCTSACARPVLLLVSEVSGASDKNMNFNDPTTITFLIYIAVMLLIGFAAWKFTDNLSDYILGGRSLGSFVTAMSAGASDMSGWLLMGLPGALYLSGVSEAWIALGLILGAWFNWRFIAARLRVFTELTDDALTLPDYFSARFEDKARLLRVISALVILVFFTLYCASGMVAGARLFEQTFAMSYSNALIFGAAATVIYVFVGGFLAVSWTDTVQASLMIFALVCVPFVILQELGGIEAAWQSIAQQKASLTAPFGTMTVVGFISLMAWGLGYMGQPHILARFMAAKNAATLKNARRIGMTWMVLCLLGAILTGFLGIAYFALHPNQAGPVSANPETVFITLSKVLFNPWLAGIFLSAILAAIMSTLSCQLLVCASALTDDFYKSYLRPNAEQRELVWVSRLCVLLVSVLALVLASDPNNSVLKMVGYAWAGFGAAFGPLVLLSVSWRRMTREGALAGMLVGALTVVLWHNGQWFGQAQGALFGLYEMVPGFVFSMIAIVLVSRITQAPSPRMQALFDEMVIRARAAD